MRIIVIIAVILLISINGMGQLPDLEKKSLLLADTIGVQYYLTSLSLWEGKQPAIEQLTFEDQKPKGKIKKMFRYGLSSEYVFSHMDEMPLYHATISDHYGCVIRTAKGLILYTGYVGREFNWDLVPPDYQEVLEELSAHGELQKYLGVKQLMEFLKHLEKKKKK